MTYLKTELDPFFIGFDKLLGRANEQMPISQKYPPYNIIKAARGHYTIQIAVAGFDEDQIDIELHNGVLTIKGIVGESDSAINFVYKGIAARSFERRFTLADTVQVDAVSLDRGMLTVKLVDIIPDEKKPRKISIGKPTEKQLLTE